MKPLYIIASSCISPQHTFSGPDLLQESDIMCSENNLLQCVEPDFKQFINPVQIRRMSRALKIGFSAAIECLNRAGDRSIDAVLVGTGKGCLEDTEAFIHSIRNYQETALNPTHFIHSTYNQLNGSIALSRKINSYNMTYVHRAFSFELCLNDASLLAEELHAENILCGSFDEITAEHFNVKDHWHYWKKERINSLELFQNRSPGTIAGEGSSFFVLSPVKPGRQAVGLAGLSMLYKPQWDDIHASVLVMLQENDLGTADIDILLHGDSADSTLENYTGQWRGLLPGSTLLYFKHLCGEYDTASQFAFYLARGILERQQVAPVLYAENEVKNRRPGPIRNILIYNNYFGINQSVLLLRLL